MPFADNEGVRLHYELSGVSHGEVLVLANSLGSSLRMWDKVLPAFEKNYSVLRYDMRGHGNSTISPGPLTIADLGGDLLALLDQVRFDRANLCGLSLGGLVAMWAAIHAPQRTSRIVLANTSARIGTREGWDARIAAVHTAGMHALSFATLDRWFTSTYRDQHPDEMETIRRMISATNQQGYSACCAVLRDTDLRPDLAAIGSPCLVITGTHDPATPPSDGQALHSALRESSYAELDASHLSAWERAEDFSTAVCEFLGAKELCNG